MLVEMLQLATKQILEERPADASSVIDSLNLFDSGCFVLPENDPVHIELVEDDHELDWKELFHCQCVESNAPIRLTRMPLHCKLVKQPDGVSKGRGCLALSIPHKIGGPTRFTRWSHEQV